MLLLNSVLVFIGFMLIVAVVLTCVYFIHLVIYGLFELLAMLLGLNGKSQCCKSRFVYIYSYSSQDFSHPGYPHYFRIDECLRCGKKTTIEHTSGYYDTWIDPCANKLREN